MRCISADIEGVESPQYAQCQRGHSFEFQGTESPYQTVIILVDDELAEPIKAPEHLNHYHSHICGQCGGQGFEYLLSRCSIQAIRRRGSMRPGRTSISCCKVIDP